MCCTLSFAEDLSNMLSFLLNIDTYFSNKVKSKIHFENKSYLWALFNNCPAVYVGQTSIHIIIIPEFENPVGTLDLLSRPVSYLIIVLCSTKDFILVNLKYKLLNQN